MTWQEMIDRYYPEGSRLRDIYMAHCRSVADLALEINRRKGLGLDQAAVEEAAMLHDIGIFMCDAPDIECHGDEPYIRHGVLGAALLRSDGLGEDCARVAERHTGAGLSREDIARQHLPLDPDGDYMPLSVLERLVCYADKFYSKSGDMQRKPLEKVIRSMQRLSPETLERFMALHREFGEQE
ncbi:HDIG domain-containing metalloprotein [Duncaniella muris]|uniref:HDIG domain-containing metalloprotein n=1 Tax=Duncaniella muris TaxID=2094150 RepID=UPI002593578D|nr:HDIG domain-containing metalloprotein [Duncaniella muris]